MQINIKLQKRDIILISLVALGLIATIIISSLVGSDTNTGTPDEPNAPEVTKQSYKIYDFSLFDTITTIIGWEATQDEFAQVSKELIKELSEYHKLFDIYNEYEGINNLYTINQLHNGEHQVVKVDRKIIDMLLYSKEMYEVTGGKTNVAMGSVLSIWHDYRTVGAETPSKAELPPMDLLVEASKHTDINDIIINEEDCTVYLADPAMTLDVGAIAKGYAVEMVARKLESEGKTGYALNVGGNIRTVGKRADGNPWKTGIENPDDTSSYVEYIEIADLAVVTSGSYQRYYVVGGKRYHHIIDADTLMPADKGFLSVSLICTSSADGDALSTALFCMTAEEGIAFVNSYEGVEALWIMDDGSLLYSNNYRDYISER